MQISWGALIYIIETLVIVKIKMLSNMIQPILIYITDCSTKLSLIVQQKLSRKFTNLKITK